RRHTTMASHSGGELLQKWLEKLKEGGKLEGSVDDAAENMKKDLVASWDELSRRLMEQESKDIGNFCESGVSWTERGSTPEGQFVQILCTTVAEIKYFMSGVERRRTEHSSRYDKPAVITALTDEEAYRRCIVGPVALSEIYGDHCKLREVIEKVQSGVEIKLIDHFNKDPRNLQNQLNKCEGVDLNALLLGKAILSDKIKQWTLQNREKAIKNNSGPWGIKMPWRYWPHVCTHSREDRTKLQQQRLQNAESMVTFTNLNNSKSNTNDASLSDILVKDEYKLPESTLQRVVRSAVSNGGGAPGASPLNMENLKQELDKAIQTQTGKNRKSSTFHHARGKKVSSGGADERRKVSLREGEGCLREREVSLREGEVSLREGEVSLREG
ncbi:SICAvar, type I (fragment), partial [Plasmodium knowlesi strain H]